VRDFAGGADGGCGGGAVRPMLRAVFALAVAGAIPSSLRAQSAPEQSAPAQTQPAQSPANVAQDGAKPAEPQKPAEQVVIDIGKPVQADSLHAQRKAAKLYLQGVKLLEKEQPEPAWEVLKQAAELEPSNATYGRAAELAKQSTVTQLVQQAARERGAGTGDDSSKLLQHALEIDPKNPIVVQHLNDFGDAVSAVATTPGATVGAKDAIASDTIKLAINTEKHSFHSRGNSRQLVTDVFRAYGIEASVHESVKSQQVRMEVDDATFPEAMRVLSLLTNTFWEPLDAHRVVVAQDTRENRTQFQRTQMETIYLPGMSDKDLAEVSNLAKNVFDAQQAVAQPTSGTMTIRAASQNLKAFNRTVTLLEEGKNQIDLNVKIISLAHVSMRETGTTFLQQATVYNVYSELRTILMQNQSLVQQIIAAGLVPNADTLANQIAILAILVGTGQVSGTPFSQGFVPFGGGLTQNVLVPGPATLTMSLNSSDTRTLDDIHMRLGDDEPGTFKIGQRYPITTSSFSSVALPAVAGISTAAIAAQQQTIPQIQYEDLGLTLKATPKVLRSDNVAINVDLKIEALGGSALNDIPILDSQQLSGVLTMRAGETAVLLSDLSKQQSRALSGLPGVSDIPGLQDISDISRDLNVARLLILITPTVIRDQKQMDHGPMLMMGKSTNAH